jgi:hypothetical protein
LEIADAGKPDCYGSVFASVGARLPATAVVHPTPLHRMYRPFAGKRAPTVLAMAKNMELIQIL